MKTICIINLKGGVGKTISAINIAYLLAAKHGKRVLLIDNDKQGNTSKFFGLHSYDALSIADALTDPDPYTLMRAIRTTEYNNLAGGGCLHLVPANMTLLRANMQILLEVERPRQTRLRESLQAMESANHKYDYVVIDNAPDMNISDINALVAADDILVPIKFDSFASDGLEVLKSRIEECKRFNPGVRIVGCFATMYQQNNVNKKGVQALAGSLDFTMFRTVIRKTVKVDESTYEGKPLAVYSPTCTAAKDFESLVAEYLEKCDRN